MSVVTMLASPLRCYKNMKIVNQGIIALGNGHCYSSGKAYSNDKGKGCCKDVAQTEGRKVESWPKVDSPPQAWRCECPREPQPPNYDPYRIKVPDVVVPPLPPSNAKRSGVVLTRSDQGQSRRTGPETEDDEEDHRAGSQHKQPKSPVAEEPADETFMGMLRGLFDRLKGKSKRGSDAMTGSNVPFELQNSIDENTTKKARIGLFLDYGFRPTH